MKLEEKYGFNKKSKKKTKDKSKKKKKPPYALIVEWRKILHRLSFFLRAIDYQILELLRRLVVTASIEMSEFFLESFKTGNDQSIKIIQRETEKVSKLRKRKNI